MLLIFGNLCVLHTSACNGPLHGEVNGIDYCFAIFGVLSHMHCCKIIIIILGTKLFHTYLFVLCKL